MESRAEPHEETLEKTGAPGGSILVGTKAYNCGLRIKIFLDQQARGNRIIGKFRVLDAGSGYHSSAFEPYVEQEFENAAKMIEVVQRTAEMIEALRKYDPPTHFLNGNSLKVEK